MKKILLTAFEPFGGEKINPSERIVGEIAGMKIPGVEVCTMIVPVTFADSAKSVTDALSAADYDAVVMLGQAGGRAAITIERVAINVQDASIPDNAGAQPQDTPVCADGPAAYFSTLPIKQLVQAVCDAGVRAAVSNSAGTFVCNHLMYSVLNYLAGTGVQAGFIHVPWLPEQAEGKKNAPSMPQEDMVKAIRVVLEALV